MKSELADECDYKREADAARFFPFNIFATDPKTKELSMLPSDFFPFPLTFLFPGPGIVELDLHERYSEEDG